MSAMAVPEKPLSEKTRAAAWMMWDLFWCFWCSAECMLRLRKSSDQSVK
jgi:hypothetical protein